MLGYYTLEPFQFTGVRPLEMSVLQLTMPFLPHSIDHIYLLYLLSLVIGVGGVLQWLSAYLACSRLCIWSPSTAKKKKNQNNTGASHWLFFTSLWQKIWQEASKGGGAYLGWHFQSVVVCEALGGVGVCDRGIWHLGRSGVELKIGWDWSLKSHSNWPTSASASSTPTSEVPQFP